MMNKKEPYDVRFVLAEDYREEAGKKLTLLGVLAGDDINLAKGDIGKALPSLIILIIARGARGKFKANVEFFAPSGSRLFEKSLPKDVEINIQEEQNFVIPIKISPFPIEEFGKYMVRFLLDDKPYEYSFIIRATQ